MDLDEQTQDSYFFDPSDWIKLPQEPMSLDGVYILKKEVKKIEKTKKESAQKSKRLWKQQAAARAAAE